ncbi:hypothetical protein [Larkinella terrae]|uniref:Uncharacterized protein n=1 Tax=Larkinella terrae TaxID=2025311 RepID=A0A7K0EP86_9BACT|nr:hypothetical protein [Larkinella terrae]MRS63653.1 hypothetical protein [Larkinella terrae]
MTISGLIKPLSRNVFLMLLISLGCNRLAQKNRQPADAESSQNWPEYGGRLDQSKF